MKQPKLNNTLCRRKAVSSSTLASKRARPTSSNLMLRSRQDAIKDFDKQGWHWIEKGSRGIGAGEEDVTCRPSVLVCDRVVGKYRILSDFNYLFLGNFAHQMLIGDSDAVKLDFPM